MDINAAVYMVMRYHGPSSISIVTAIVIGKLDRSKLLHSFLLLHHAIPTTFPTVSADFSKLTGWRNKYVIQIVAENH